jgi:hypothetical protein
MTRAVVLFAIESAAALAGSLADLVPGAVDGVIRRVTVAATADASEALFEVSDDAGASFLRLEGEFGARAAKACEGGDELLLLVAGTRLPPHWHEDAGDHLRLRPDEVLLIEGDKAGLLGARSILALLVPRAHYAAAGGFTADDTDLRPLLRRLRRFAAVTAVGRDRDRRS